jgi:putative ABC transport system ATP-binding protein/lipoprotein-releasing system ATP-binding protein
VSRLVVERVSKTYPVNGKAFRAVDDVSFRIERGEFASIIGHSGSGKTTLLSMVGGLTRPSSGTILFDDTDVHRLGSDALSEYRSERIGFVFQFASLLPALTATENLLLPGTFRSRRRAPEEDAERALQLLELVGLRDKAGAHPAELSGGQQRRIAIARAFMNEPALILADEPTGDLDEETEADVMKVFRTMNERNATTILLVTHNTDLAQQASRRMKMHHGALREL